MKNNSNYKGIVVFGAVFVDIKGYPLNTYIPAGRNVGRVEQVHGGVARNIVEDIANMELRPSFVSIVDESAIGTEVIDKLNNHKVNTEYMLRTPDGMGTWLAVFDNRGDVVASISKRPDLSPILSLLNEKGDEIFEKADSVALEIDMDKEIVKKILELSKKHNTSVYAAVSNMSIAAERRDFLQKTDCFVCNIQEAGILFMDEYEDKSPEEMAEILAGRVKPANIKRMVVTMGSKGSVYADSEGNYGVCPPKRTDVKDTTGAGDAFFAGVTVGLTYGKELKDACKIGTMLATSVINTSENVCPRFLPSEFGIEI